jgi:hypothetical protein
VILVAQFWVGITSIREKPLFERNSDEIGHLEMARYVATENRLPGQREVDWSTETLQFTQPPLYYVFTAPIIRLIDDGNPVPGQPNPIAVCNGYNNHLTNWARPQDFAPDASGAVRVGYFLRGMQLLFALATTTLTFRSTRLLFPEAPYTALRAAAMIAFLPTLVSTTAYIGNDWPVIFIGALALYITLWSLQTRNSVKPLILGFALTLLLGFVATLSKVTGWTVFVLLVPIGFRIFFRTRITRRMALSLIAGVVIFGLSITGFNLAVYGSVIGRYPATWLNLHMAVQDIVRLAANEFWSSIVIRGQFDTNRIPQLSQVNEASLVLVTLGMVLLIVRGLKSRARLRTLAVPLLLFTASATLILIRNLTAVNALYIFAPFRYLGPGIPALAIIAAAGLGQFPGVIGRAVQLIIPVTWFLLSLLIPLQSAATVIRAESNVADNHLPTGATRVEAEQSELPLIVEGYKLAEDDTFSDGTLDLTLYLRAPNHQADSLAMLDLQAGETSCRFIPVSGFRPNISLQAGELIAAQVQLPYCGEVNDVPVPVTLSWRNASSDGRTTTAIDADPIPLFVIEDGLINRASGCIENLGTFDNMFQIIKSNFPTTVRAGDSLTLSVNWLAKANTPISYTRIFSITDAHGGEVARCEGIPRMGSYPTNSWREGEVIYDDSCVLDLPDSLPPAEYTLWVGITDPQSGRYLSADTVQSDLLPLGFIYIENR